MPYVITTATPLKGEPVHEPLDRITRTAVATLDEARTTVMDIGRIPPSGRVYPVVIMGAESLPESGGTVGPLPDGTVIEVRPVSWPALRAERVTTHYVPEGDHAAIIAAFNLSGSQRATA